MRIRWLWSHASIPALRLMERYPDILEVLTVAQPPLEKFVGPRDAVTLAKIANDEMAELVDRYSQPLHKRLTSHGNLLSL
jgi:hypothetical protein